MARGATRRYRGTGVNASGRVERLTGSEADDDDDDDDTDEEDGRERLGFDRLRAVSELNDSSPLLCVI